MKKIYLSFLILISVCFAASAQTSVYSENFANVSTMLSTGGWTEVNNSQPLGLEIWHDGVGLAFATGLGVSADSNYAEVSYQSTDAAGSGDISNWLISPPIMLNNADVVSFFTTSYNNLAFPDRLELRVNPLNTLDVGTTSTSVGDFTLLLTTVNPSLLADTSVYPQDYWGQVYATVSGLSGATLARIAFRYWVTDGGGTGANSSTIGVDSLNVTTIVGINELVSFEANLFPNPAQDLVSLSWNQSMSNEGVASIYNSLGQKVQSHEIAKGIQHVSFDVSGLSKGVYTVFLNTAEGYSRNTFIKD